MALFFSTQMATLTGNTSGAIQSLLTPGVGGRRERVWGANVALAAQAAGSQIAVARLPLQAVITGITAITDTSLGTATIALGDVHAGNSAIYIAAQVLTAVNTPARIGLAAAHLQPIATGYDCVNGNLAPYEDIVITTGVAALPGAGNLVLIFEYVID
jgi:hypothetical protein